PSEIASIEATPSLAAVRLPYELSMFSPKHFPSHTHLAAGRSEHCPTKRKNTAAAMTSRKFRESRNSTSLTILYVPHQGLNPTLLDRIVATPYSRDHNWHSRHEIAKYPDVLPRRCRIHPYSRPLSTANPPANRRLPKEPSWLKPNFVRCMTVSWSSVSMPKRRAKAASSS